MKIVFLILVFLFIGFAIYKLKGFKFTSNSKVILNLLLNELSEIRVKLNEPNLSEQYKIALINRRNEINNTLAQFFGKNIAL